MVDDSQTFRDSLSVFFYEHGIQCSTAENGELGLEVWNNNTDIDLVIADHNMPIMSGIEMVSKIRASETDGKKVPIFMLTAESSSSLKDSAKELGVTAWIVKPVANDALLKAVRKVLGI